MFCKGRKVPLVALRLMMSESAGRTACPGNAKQIFSNHRWISGILYILDSKGVVLPRNCLPTRWLSGAHAPSAHLLKWANDRTAISRGEKRIVAVARSKGADARSLERSLHGSLPLYTYDRAILILIFMPGMCSVLFETRYG